LLKNANGFFFCSIITLLSMFVSNFRKTSDGVIWQQWPDVYGVSVINIAD